MTNSDVAVAIGLTSSPAAVQPDGFHGSHADRGRVALYTYETSLTTTADVCNTSAGNGSLTDETHLADTVGTWVSTVAQLLEDGDGEWRQRTRAGLRVLNEWTGIAPVFDDVTTNAVVLFAPLSVGDAFPVPTHEATAIQLGWNTRRALRDIASQSAALWSHNLQFYVMDAMQFPAIMHAAGVPLEHNALSTALVAIRHRGFKDDVASCVLFAARGPTASTPGGKVSPEFPRGLTAKSIEALLVQYIRDPHAACMHGRTGMSIALPPVMVMAAMTWHCKLLVHKIRIPYG